jgi:hypothetical protein
MAKHVLYDAFVSVNSVDLSDHVQLVTYELGINPQPAAAMGEVQDYDMPGTQTISPIVINYFQDFAVGEVWATHKGLWVNRSTFTLIVKPTSGADAATNPAFTVSVFVASQPVISGARGDAHMVQITYNPAGVLTIDEA